MRAAGVSMRRLLLAVMSQAAQLGAGRRRTRFAASQQGQRCCQQGEDQHNGLDPLHRRYGTPTSPAGQRQPAPISGGNLVCGSPLSLCSLSRVPKHRDRDSVCSVLRSLVLDFRRCLEMAESDPRLGRVSGWPVGKKPAKSWKSAPRTRSLLSSCPRRSPERAPPGIPFLPAFAG